MDLEFIEQIVALVRGAQITELTVRSGDERLTVRKSPQAGPLAAHNLPPASEDPWENEDPASPWKIETPEAPELSPSLTLVRAHLVGIFYRGLGPESPPLKEVGDWVEKGDSLGMIESMRNLMEIHSPVQGRIAAVLVADGQPVEYGQELFEVEATEEPLEE